MDRGCDRRGIGLTRWVEKAIACGWGLCLAGSVGAVQVTDDLGVTVDFPSPPRRIVSLLPALTEVVCALGECQRLVGVDRYSNHPDRVRQVPQVGGGLDPNVEAIVALKPDLVLMATSAQMSGQLRSLGIHVLAMEPKRHADVKRSLVVMGQVLGVKTALNVWREIEAGLRAVARSLPPRVRGIRVYFEVNNTPIAAGEASFIGETLALLGARNIVSAEWGPFPSINPEFVVRADPDVIMVGDILYTGVDDRPGWAGIRAVRRQHVCVFTPGQSDALVRPGPRIAEGARLMAGCLIGKALK